MLARSNKFVQQFLPDFVAALPPVAEGAEGERPPPVLQILWPDEGSSAFAAKNWQLPPGVAVGSMPRAKVAEGIEALLLVAPAATEVPAVQRLVNEIDESAPGTLLILVNPKLVDMQSTGYGLVGRDLRNMVEALSLIHI